MLHVDSLACTDSHNWRTSYSIVPMRDLTYRKAPWTMAAGGGSPPKAWLQDIYLDRRLVSCLATRMGIGFKGGRVVVARITLNL